MTSKPPIHRHPIVGTRHPDHPVAVHHHDKVMAREHHQHDRRNALAYLNSDDHPSCVLPKDGSHTQGNHNHPAEYVRDHGLTRQGETAKNPRPMGGERATATD